MSAAQPLVAGPDPELHSPDEAVELAREATRLTGGSDPSTLDTLATAYDAVGQEEKALATARRALWHGEARRLRGRPFGRGANAFFGIGSGTLGAG